MLRNSKSKNSQFTGTEAGVTTLISAGSEYDSVIFPISVD